MNATHKCDRCGTEYFEAGECDWCPGAQRIPQPSKKITDADFKYTPAVDTDIRKTFARFKR